MPIGHPLPQNRAFGCGEARKASDGKGAGHRSREGLADHPGTKPLRLKVRPGEATDKVQTLCKRCGELWKRWRTGPQRHAMVCAMCDEIAVVELDSQQPFFTLRGWVVA